MMKKTLHIHQSNIAPSTAFPQGRNRSEREEFRNENSRANRNPRAWRFWRSLKTDVLCDARFVKSALLGFPDDRFLYRRNHAPREVQ
jgi:hypothetical protein